MNSFLPQHPLRNWWGLCLGIGCWIISNIPAAAQTERWIWTDFGSFERATNQQNQTILLTSPIHRSNRPWSQALVSWNAETPGASGCEFQIQAGSTDPSGSFYSFGRWAERTNAFTRSSAGRQTDADGEVQTDLFKRFHPANSLRLRVILHPDAQGSLPHLKLLSLSLDSGNSPVALESSRPVNRPAWGKHLAIPEKSQHAYPKGISWCSPTSLTMVLGYWGEQLKRRELEHSVPEVAEGVFDPGWNGTGNWPFNTAYAGASPLLRAAVLRLNGMADLEESVSHRVPVIISVSLNLLRGRPARSDDGHLVVVSGFTETGDVWIHDPDTPYPPVPGKTVRRVYPREAVDKAWASSRRTCYVIEPKDRPYWLRASTSASSSR